MGLYSGGLNIGRKLAFKILGIYFPGGLIFFFFLGGGGAYCRKFTVFVFSQVAIDTRKKNLYSLIRTDKTLCFCMINFVEYGDQTMCTLRFYKSQVTFS